MLRLFLYLVSQLTYIGGQEYSHSSEPCLKSREILALCVTAFDPSTNYHSVLLFLSFPWVMMEVSHAEEVCQAESEKFKAFLL